VLGGLGGKGVACGYEYEDCSDGDRRVRCVCAGTGCKAGDAPDTCTCELGPVVSPTVTGTFTPDNDQGCKDGLSVVSRAEKECPSWPIVRN
jgi:hypothetical protein